MLLNIDSYWLCANIFITENLENTEHLSMAQLVDERRNKECKIPGCQIYATKKNIDQAARTQQNAIYIFDRRNHKEDRVGQTPKNKIAHYMAFQ